VTSTPTDAGIANAPSPASAGVERVEARKPVVLLAEPLGFSPRAFDLLAKEADVRPLLEKGRAALLASLPDADVLWVRLANRVDGEVLEAAPRLSAIVTPTTGLNHVDLEAAAARGVAVLSLRGRTDMLREVHATAEHAIGLMLALLRHVPEACEHVKAGGWDRDRFRGRELHGATVGIVGLGRLGRLVARMLLAFEARVLAADPNVPASAVPDGVTLVSLPELVRRAEIVSIHASLSEESHGFFGAKEFAAMRPGALLVNTARGELVDEAALLAALESGRLGGAALDVLAGEDASGMAHHPLVAYARQHPNVIVTPHLGGCTSESMEKTEVFMAETLVAHLAEAAR
jgi:D-3-phosphoglycerate dehydrogenase